MSADRGEELIGRWHGHAAPPRVDPVGSVGLIGKGSTVVSRVVGPVTNVSSCLIVSSIPNNERLRREWRSNDELDAWTLLDDFQ